LTHGAVETVHGECQRHPSVYERREAVCAVGIKIGIGRELSIENFGADANAEGAGRLQRIDNMEIMRKCFGEVLPGMHTGIGAHKNALPAARRAIIIVALARCVIVLSFVAEESAAALDIAAVTHELIPIVVPNLVPDPISCR